MSTHKNFHHSKRLPHCHYPTAAATELHGLQPLPDILPLITIEGAQEYRSPNINLVSAGSLEPAKLLQLAQVLAASFAINDPMLRYLRPPKECPPEILNLKHKDPFGDDYFGSWTKENILFWLIRLFIITDPFSPLDAIKVSDDTIRLSLAALNDEGEIIGGALNVQLDISNPARSLRSNDPFINAVFPLFEANSQFLTAQINLSLNAVCKKYPAFLTALRAGKVGDLSMVARSPLLPSGQAFELMAASALRLLESGFEYLVVAAGNQWTGAACEVLAGVMVHFAPYRDVKRVSESAEAIPDKPSSTDGFISDKDSGCMLYVIRLK